MLHSTLCTVICSLFTLHSNVLCSKLHLVLSTVPLPLFYVHCNVFTVHWITLSAVLQSRNTVKLKNAKHSVRISSSASNVRLRYHRISQGQHTYTTYSFLPRFLKTVFFRNCISKKPPLPFDRSFHMADLVSCNDLGQP